MIKSVTVGTTATKLLEMFPSRKQWTMQNQGGTDVYWAYTNKVSAVSGSTTQGFLLPGGVNAVINSNSRDDPVTIQKELWAIVAAGSQVLIIDEG